MNEYAVIGKPIDHSLSPVLHQHFAKQFGLVFNYRKMLVEPGCFEQCAKHFFQNGGIGFNVTSPYKQDAFALSDTVTDRCMKARAANLVWQKDGKIVADTTDGVGLMRDLGRYIDVSEKSLLIIGAGGVVRSILGPLLDCFPARITLANRTEVKALALQIEFNRDGLIDVTSPEKLNQPYDVIIYATAARETQLTALPEIIFQNVQLAYDLNYNQRGLTPFVQYARSFDCQAIDGFGMLVYQAAESFKIWHGLMPEISSVDALKLL